MLVKLMELTVFVKLIFLCDIKSYLGILNIFISNKRYHFMEYRSKSLYPYYQATSTAYQTSMNTIPSSIPRNATKYSQTNKQIPSNLVTPVNQINQPNPINQENPTNLEPRHRITQYSATTYPTVSFTKDTGNFANIYSRPKDQGQIKQKQKIKEVSDDLAKLKKKLESMIIRPQSVERRTNQSYLLNRTPDKFSTPNVKINTIKQQNNAQNYNPETPQTPQKSQYYKEQHTYYNNYSEKKPNQNKRFVTQPPINSNYYINRPTYNFGTINSQTITISPNPNIISNTQNLQTQKNGNQNGGVFKGENIYSQNKNANNIIDNNKTSNKQTLPKNISSETSIQKQYTVNNTTKKYDYTFKTLQSKPTFQTTAIQNNKQYNKILELEKQKIQLQAKLDQIKSQKQNLRQEKERFQNQLNNKTTKYKFLQQKHAKVCQQYKECLQRQELLREKVMILERELIVVKSKSKNNFEDVLKGQFEQTNKIKQTIQQKNEQILRLNDIILQNRRKAEQAINNTVVDKLKFTTQKKQIEQLHQIQILHKQNEIKTLRHSLQTMQAKLQVAVKDNKHKDQFLKQHLMGRLKQGQEKQYVNRVLSKYQIQFPINELANKLIEEQEQIRYLKKIIQEQKARLT